VRRSREAFAGYGEQGVACAALGGRPANRKARALSSVSVRTKQVVTKNVLHEKLTMLQALRKLRQQNTEVAVEAFSTRLTYDSGQVDEAIEGDAACNETTFVKQGHDGEGQRWWT
jgi:hypothetical protein